MSGSAWAVRIESLSAGYGEETVISDLSLGLRFGRTTVITGPGGSGKSTLLRIIAGERGPGAPWTDGGVYATGGANRRLDARGSLGPALLSQRRATDLAGVEDLAADGRLREVWRCAPEAAGALEAELASASPPAWACRLAQFTQVAAQPADILLFDEPEVGASESGREWMVRKLQTLRGRHTIGVVTHNLQLARAIADDVVLLVDGVVVESGEVEAFFERPVHPRTRHFVRMGA